MNKYRLSIPQKNILMAEQYYSETAVNNNCAVLFLPDADIPALAESVNHFIADTQAMRFVLADKNELPENAEQIILPYEYENIPVSERREKDEEYYDELKKIFSEKLDTEKKLFRFVIFSFSDGSAELVFVIHHLICDGFSLTEAVKTVAKNYESIHRGEVPSVRMSDYTDYLQSEENYLSGKKYERNIGFWREYLKNDFVPAGEQYESRETSAERTEIYLSDKEKDILSEIMKISGGTQASVLMSLFGLYFAKISGSERTALGSPYFNRVNASERKTFGVFASMLPVIFDIGGGQNFSGFCEKNGDLTVSLLRHQRIPYGDIQNIAYELHGISGKLYNVIYNYIPIEINEIGEADWKHNGTSEYGLCIHVTELKKGSIRICFDRLADVVSENDVKRIYKTVFGMAEWICSHPEADIKTVPLIFGNDIEAYKKLNDTRAEYDETLTVNDLIERQRGSDRTAVICGGRRMSQPEFDDITDRIAASLRKRNITSGSTAAVCMKRGAEYLCAVFGVIKSGAAFLPMDINWPDVRKENVLSDSRAEIIIGDDVYSALVSESTAAEYTAAEVSPDDTCYIIYTSGSTGKPKGVMLTHKNAVNFSLPLKYNYLVKEIYERCENVLSMGNLSFDISISEYFPALLNGKTLILVNDEELNSVEKLTACIVSNGADCIQCTPSRLLEYTDYEDFSASLKQMKVIMAAAEVFPEALADRIKNLSDAVLLNGYGPTETTMGASYSYVGSGKITVGKPISNVSMYITDSFGDILPPMQIGELCIGGNGVGKGYIGPDELNRKSFPVYENIGRVYRTGDLARLNDNGEIEFLGRKDRQVKLHGLRIETAEIENVMLTYPSVTAAAVKVFGEGKSAYLAGYYSVSCDTDEADLRKYMSERLTYYMVPSALCRLDVIPVTSNGKTDYRNLPEISVSEEIVPCETETQKKLYEIVTDLLGTDRIGITTDLFRAGMTSLSSLKLNSAIAKEFGADIGAAAIMRSPDIKSLEKYILETSSSANAVFDTDGTEEFPLSGGQTGIWLECASEEDRFNYHIPVKLVFSAGVDAPRLASAVGEAITAHPYLLSEISVRGGVPVIKRAERQEFAVICEKSGTPESIVFVRPFDIGGGRLCRAAVYYNDDKVCLYIDIHHILCDGLTVQLLLKDIENIYLGGKASAESCDGFEYSLREKAIGSGKMYDESLGYYDDLFAGAEQASEVRPEINGSRHTAESVFSRLSDDDAENIGRFTEKYGVTAGNILLAAAEFVLSVYSRTDDVIIAAAENGRSSARFETTFAMTVKTLILRNKVSADESVSGFVRRVSDNLYENISHDKVPYTVLTERYDIIPKIMFTYQNVGIEDLRIIEDGVSVSSAEISDAQAKFPISFDISGNNIRIEYDSGKYEKAVIEKLAESFVTAVHRMAAAPEKLISEISICTDADIAKINSFNDRTDDFPRGESVVSVFEKAVDSAGDKLALAACDGEFTYNELDRKANRIANALIKRGVAHGDIVMLRLPRTSDVIASMFGIMKAGAAYLPLDTENPAERVDFIGKDSHAAFDINPGNIDELLAETDDSRPCVNITGDSLCYVIYTSGSTGTPKGVMTEHGNVLNYALPLKYNHQILTAVNECDTSVAVGSLAFDIAVAEIYPFLLAGKPVAFADEEQVLDAGKLAQLIKKYHADFILCTPTRLLQYVENKEFADVLADFHSISAAGEAVTPIWLRKVRSLTSAKLYNGYGPTETTAGCTFKEITSDIITIGPPVSNVHAHVLDERMNPVPVLVPGELCITGRGVARGYLNRPDLTERSFIDSPDGRMYRTGDIVYWTEDGDLQYMGRADGQVKLRGLRIELSEIESVISSYGGIDDCAVLVKGSGSRAVLCAYIAASHDIDEKSLREYISGRLTGYMVPSDFVYLDKMPMNANGKTDRKALALIETERKIVPCSTDTQRRLHDILTGILECSDIGADDDLYRLGLTSLSAMKLSYRIQEVFGAEISSKTIMRNTSIEKLEKLVLTAENTVISAHEDIRLYPLTKGQTGIYAEYDKNRNSVSYNMPMHWSFEKGIDISRLEAAVKYVIDLHPYLKSYIVRKDSRLYICRNDSAEAEVSVFGKAAARDDLVRPFDLEKGPLYRFEIYDSEERTELFIDIHHIVSDGASSAVILEDIKNAYENGSALPEQKTAFDNSLEIIPEDEFDSAKRYFAEMFAGVDGGNRIFADNKDEGRSEAAYLVEKMPAGMTDRIKDVSVKFGVTPASVCFAAFLLTVSKYSMNNKVAVGTVDSGRNSPSYRRSVGMFVRTLPFCTEVKADETFGGFVRKVHAEMLEVTENSVYTYTDISEDLGLVLDTHFVYNEVVIGDLSIGGYAAKEIPTALKDAKFALTLSVSGDLLQLDYRGDLYNAETCRKFLRSFVFCIEQAESCAEMPLGNFSLAAYADTEAYRRLNDTDVDSPYTTMDRMFMSALEKYPDRTAVVCGENDSLTYRELGECAERIAAGLAQRGVTKNTVAAFCLPRGIGIVKAIFGIIRAGAAILPTDITWPEERTSYVVENSGAKILITEDVLKELENSDGSLAPVLDVTPDDLSYVIYTSGSTGKPKGAMLIQRNLTNFLKPLEHNCLVSEMYRKCRSILSISNVTFDISICEIFPAIFYGRKLAFADERAFDNPRVLSAFALRHNVDCIQGTPSRISQYLEEPDFVKCLGNVKVMLVAGETLSHALTDKLREVSDTVILNGYGPTETTLAASYQYVSDKKITIGRPVANAKMYVVDKWLNLQPQGCVGELCIGGCNVGTGYINRDDLTKEKFVRDPFGNGTLYHSGDLARLTDDGEIDFLGRMDNQIKLHGLRIELDEIESVMSDHPQVTACAVKVVGSGKNAYLCGYYTADGVLVSDDLKDFLRKRLTYYMVPSVLVCLDAMPISTAGKIDRQNLPVIDINEETVPCETKLQKEIADLLGNILGTDDIGLNTDLFRLGLTSLLAVRLGAALFDRFGVELRSMDILRNNTVSLLERLIAAHSGDEKTSDKTFEKLEEYPLTDNQMGVYIEAVKDLSDMKYNMPSAYGFDGTIDPQRLADACRTAVAAHSYLNGYLRETDTEPVFVRNDGYVPEIEVKYSDDPENIDFVRPFVLTEPPLYRMAIYYNEKMTCLYADFHHIIFDGESLDIFMNDVKKAYEGEEILPEKFTAFDHALNMRNVRSNDRGYSLARFEGVSSVSSIRQDRNEKGKPLGRIVRTADETLVPAVEKYAAGSGVTVSSVYLAAYLTVVSRMTRRSDTVTAAVWDGRNDRRFAGSIGMFVKTLPLYLKSDNTQGVSSFVNEVQQELYRSADENALSYGEFCSETGLVPEILYVYQNHAGEAMKLGDSEVRGLESVSPSGLMSAKFPITLNVIGREMILEYDTGRYDESTMLLMLDAVINVTESIVSEKAVLLGDIMLADDSDTEKIRRFNATETEFPHDETLVSLFEKQADKNPGKTAVIGKDRTLTYSELDRLADRTANSLISRGIRRGDIVPVRLPRTSSILAVFFGIMKAGAAYLPLDINYPDSRVEYCMQDSGAKLLIDESNVNEFLSYPDDSRPDVMLSCRDLCYIIYTSGSTGKPKGVMAEHRGVMNYSLPLKYNHHAVTIVEKCSVSLAIGSLAFDIAVAEIYPFLLSGETVVLADENDSNDVVALAELAVKYHADALLCTPSRLLKYVEYEPFAKALGNFKSISAAGEAVPISWLKKMRELTDAKLYNGYGPTETTAGSVFLEMNDDYVNIGNPLSNEKVFIVDEAKQQLPIGMAGELCIAGYGVSRGYLNRPELTAEKFVEVPYAEGRMYCTGDLAKWNERGELEYLGRTDSQIKYHGYRIETGEIEQVINDYEDIETSAVVLRNIDSAQYMFAYFTAKKKTDIAELKKYMSGILPSYMIPTAFMQLDEMPLDLNAKIDRRALPDIDFMSSQSYSAPENDRERALCEVFAKVLGLEKVSADASFFELGGDSIKGIQVASKIIEYGYRMQMRELFTAPSARQMAPLLRSAAVSDEGEISGASELSAIQRYFFSLGFENKHHWNQSVQLAAKGKINITALEKAFDALCRHHDELRADFEYTDGILKKTIASPDERSMFEIAVCGESAAEAEMQKLSESLELRGCKVKALVIRGENTDKLFIAVHHLVIDTVSWRIILEDISDFYDAAVNGRKYALPQKTSSYKKYAEEQNKYAHSTEAENALEYWLAEDKIPHGIIPTDFVLAGIRKESGQCGVSHRISSEDTALILKAASGDNGIRINDLMISALLSVLKEKFGTSSVPVMSEGHGRESFADDVDVSRTVGWFTSFYTLVFKAEDDDIGTLLGVKEKLGGIPENGFSYTVLKYLADGGFGIQPEVQFNYLGEFGNEKSDGYFTFEEIGKVCDRDKDSPVIAKLSVSASVLGGVMTIDIGYDGGEYRSETVSELIGKYAAKLAEIAGRIITGGRKFYAPSDLGCAGMSADDWTKVCAAVGDIGNAEVIYPATDMQSGMLLLAEHYRERSYYHEQLMLAVPFEINENDLRSRLEKAVSRHPVLRSVFVSAGLRTPYQIIRKQASPDFETINISRYAKDWQAGQPLGKTMSVYLEQYMSADRQKGFDIEKETMFRVRLFKTGSNSDILMLSFSHVILDKWSTDNLLKELFGKADEVPDNYGGYMKWYRTRNRGAALGYWKELMNGAPDTQLPVTGKNSQTPVACTFSAETDEKVTEKMAEVCRSHGITASSFMQLAWGRTLSEYLGSEEAVFGYTYSGRPGELPHTDEMTGMFIRTLPVRIKSSDTFESVQHQSLETENYSYVSSADIQKVAKLRHPAFRYFMTFQNTPDNSGNGIYELFNHNRSVNDLNVFVKSDSRVNIMFEYDGDKFTEEQIGAVSELFIKNIMELTEK